MLSSVFRFSLPEVSSSIILKDLLRSFKIERPINPNRAPPWDLSVILSYLKSARFEPLEAVSLRELTIKTLFLVSLATAKRVGELQAISRQFSRKDNDIYLSYLPEFRAKTESETNPLPRHFCVKSLIDFVGNLEEELLLCPVRAIDVYVSKTSRLLPSPRSLFRSPRNPSRSLSKNAMSFFLRDVIIRATEHGSCPGP